MAQAPMEYANQMPIDIIKLNVGGTIFTTTRATLLTYPDSHLAALINHEIPTARDRDGNIFIDRNGKWFECILDFLRDDQSVPPRPIYRQVLQEASFYGINRHIQAASRRLNEVQGANEIRQFINNYENILNNIIKEGPKYILCIELRSLDVGIDQHNTTEDGVKIGTFNQIIELKRFPDAQSIVKCLWRDLRSDGYNVEINFYPLYTFFDKWRTNNWIPRVYCMFTNKGE